MEESTKIYWEKQESSLCGVHCVNNLLQGAYFSEWDLSSIAVQLTEEERKLMMAGGAESAEFLSFMAQDSHHVDDSGNFSVEVLKKALSTFGLSLVSYGSETTKNARENPCGEIGFICNLSSHWFAVRKLGIQWFNVNSLCKQGPEFISDFYLSAFLSQLASEGYSIFVVQGKYPRSMAGSEGSGRGQWMNVADVITRSKTVTKKEPKKPAKPMTEEEQLHAAMQASMDEAKQKSDDAYEREQLERAMNMSLDARPAPPKKVQPSAPPAAVAAVSSSPASSSASQEDRELELALKMSMQQSDSIAPIG